MPKFFENNSKLIAVIGEKRVEFINGMISNDIESQAAVYAGFLDRFGRVLSDCYAYKFEEHILLIVSETGYENIKEKLIEDSKLVNIEIRDITNEYKIITMIGEDSEDYIEKKYGVKIDPITEIEKERIDVVRREFGSMKVYDLIYEHDKNVNFEIENEEEYENIRIKEGVPKFGVDFDEKSVFSEIGDIGISYTKGCFVGQEPIARIKNIGKGNTAKKLRSFVSENKISVGDEIKFEDNAAGLITSAKKLDKHYAIGYLKRGFYEKTEGFEIDGNEVRVKQ